MVLFEMFRQRALCEMYRRAFKEGSRKLSEVGTLLPTAELLLPGGNPRLALQAF